MPTALPRHTITETPDVKAWLDAAATVWVDDADNRPALLRRLLEAGHQSATDSLADATTHRTQLISRVSGSMPDVWPPNWYQQYKQDEWP